MGSLFNEMSLLYIPFKQISNPGEVLVIGFLSFNSPDILGVSNDNVTGILQDIRNWNPILPR